jgi:peptidoglycan-N-acetylglucosamine deacetylase
MSTFITTSWDDGHPADLRIAEMLTRHGLRGTFYIPRSVETGVMSLGAMREIGEKFEVGAHTLNHVFLSNTDDTTAQNEISGSKAWVEDVTGRACTLFCPPAGRFFLHHLPMFRQAGFVAIRTVEFMSFDPPRLCTNGLLEMPTTMQAFPQPALNYAKNLAKRRAVKSFWRYAIYGRSRDWVQLAKNLASRALAEGGVFHIWGHSWEVEQTKQWGRLDEVLGFLAQLQREQNVPCLSNGEICERALNSPRKAEVGMSRSTRAAIL